MGKILSLALICLLCLTFIISGVMSAMEENAVTRLVEDFGRSLKLVSILAPGDVVEQSLREHYSDYLTPELLDEWILCPAMAPGRTTSNSWPGRIEVTEIRKVSRQRYAVEGNIFEVTSTEEAGCRQVSLVVERRGRSWQIGTVLLLPPRHSCGDLLGERDKLSLAEKIGQLVMVGVEGPGLDNNTKKLVQDHHVGGFVLFARNIQSVEQTLALANSLKQANQGNKLPLFLAVDEEGGRVSRLPQEFASLPSSKTIGDSGDGVLANQVGIILGQRVKALGLNMDFAPVLDINSNPANPVIGDRSFGAEPDVVTDLGIQAMKGIQAKGVISVVKHFPGHGDTAVDSHVGLPRVEFGLGRLQNFELIPFQEAISQGADMVMTAHILLPQLDPDNPATLSRAIITDLLRQELGFDGVVITDDLTMGAIQENFDLGQAAVQAINAGADMVLVCHDNANYIEVLTALTRAVQEGRISETRLDEAVFRILALKQRYGLTDERTGAVDIDGINRSVQEVFHGDIH